MIDIAYTYSDHMTKAVSEYHHRSRKFWLSNGIGLAIVLLEFILYFKTSDEKMLGIALFVLLLLGISYFLICYVQPRKFANDGRYAKPFTLSIGNEELRLRSEDFDNAASWSEIKKACETKSYYYLFLDRTHFWIVPKDAFGSHEQEERFKEIASRHLAISRGLLR